MPLHEGAEDDRPGEAMRAPPKRRARRWLLPCRAYHLRREGGRAAGHASRRTRKQLAALILSHFSLPPRSILFIYRQGYEYDAGRYLILSVFMPLFISLEEPLLRASSQE